MSGGNDFDQASGQIETAVSATIDHALELLADSVGTQVIHLYVDAAIGRRTAGAYFCKDAARYDIARRPFAAWIDQIGRATSELQSLMRISYAVFCLKKKT